MDPGTVRGSKQKTVGLSLGSLSSVVAECQRDNRGRQACNLFSLFSLFSVSLFTRRIVMRKLIRNRKGQGLVEYALIIAGVALIGIVGITMFGHKVADMIGTVAAILTTVCWLP